MSFKVAFIFLALISSGLNLVGLDGFSLFSYARKSRVTKLRTTLPLEPPSTVPFNPTERGLLNSTFLSAKSILDNCQITNSKVERNYPNQLMGFVTPWNRRGYDVALKYKNKFSIIVPVWYTVSFD